MTLPYLVKKRGKASLKKALYDLGLVDATCKLLADPIDPIVEGVLTPTVGPAMTVTGSLPVVASPIAGVPAWSMDGSSCAIQTTGTTDVGDTEDSCLIALVRTSNTPFAAAYSYILANRADGSASRGVAIIDRWDLGISGFSIVVGDSDVKPSVGSVAPLTTYLLSSRVNRADGKIYSGSSGSFSAGANLPAGTFDGNAGVSIGAVANGGLKVRSGTQILGAAVFIGVGICATTWTSATIGAICSRVLC